MSAYIKAPPGKLKGSISEICDEDKEDFEQEQLIKRWLEQLGTPGAVDLKHISRKGTARNTLDKRSIRLDKKVSDDDGSRTYADLIAGCDGRDLVDRLEPVDPRDEAKEIIHGYLSALGFNTGEILWLVTTLKLSIAGNEKLFLTSASDLEW